MSTERYPMDNTDWSTDKDGKPIDEEVSQFMRELYTRTMCHGVLCHWHETGRVGYWSKRGTAESTVFEIAAKHGMRVDNVSSRTTVLHDNAAYVEFVPIDFGCDQA
jgi:hypothetical protein